MLSLVLPSFVRTVRLILPADCDLIGLIWVLGLGIGFHLKGLRVGWRVFMWNA
ncbi:hypothetical protein Hanom_Chr09g00821341 [Helianthus anomalus]